MVPWIWVLIPTYVHGPYSADLLNKVQPHFAEFCRLKNSSLSSLDDSYVDERCLDRQICGITFVAGTDKGGPVAWPDRRVEPFCSGVRARHGAPAWSLACDPRHEPTSSGQGQYQSCVTSLFQTPLCVLI